MTIYLLVYDPGYAEERQNYAAYSSREAAEEWADKNIGENRYYIDEFILDKDAYE